MSKVGYTIGARVLRPEMMKCSFQHTKAVLDVIEDIRDTAYRDQNEFSRQLREEPNDALMNARGYNNAISILGSRGAGKTSIIMTLQHILKVGEKNWEANSDSYRPVNNNIIMPILVPQDFSEGQTFLSWVISQLLEEAEKIEREIESTRNGAFVNNEAFRKWLPEENRKLMTRYDPLHKCMDDLTASYELRYKSDKKSNDTASDHVYQYMDEVRRDSKLILDMLKLISIMMDYYRGRFSLRNDLGSDCTNKVFAEPLLFFLIDDLDLAPNRSQEVLNLVLRYLQHPNIVVLCGWNQELFQSHLSIELFKNQGILSGELLNTNFGFDDVFLTRQRKRVAALDSARRLAMDNLKKAFPPALRFEIRSLSTIQRAFFPHVPTEKLPALNDEPDSFMPLIERSLLAANSQKRRGGRVPFLYNDSDDYILTYMRIFDNKARGLINTYKAFERLRIVFENWDKSNDLDMTSDIRSLLDTILVSNTHFAPYRQGIRDLVRVEKIVLSKKLTKSSICSYYCGYSSISSVLRDYLGYRTSIDSLESRHLLEREYNYFPSLVLDVYILLNFMENLIRYICGLSIPEHRGLEFSDALNEVIPPIHVSSASNLLLAQAIELGEIDSITLFPQTENFRLNLVLLDLYEKNGFEDHTYDFAGSYSYCRLFNAFCDLVSVNARKGRTQNTNASRLAYVRSIVPEWEQSMENLFAALRYSRKNVRRLAKYRSLLQQGMFEYESELRAVANEEENSSFTRLMNAGILESDQPITDTELDALVSCLRWMGEQYRRFSANLLTLDRATKKASDNAISYENLISVSRIEGYIEAFQGYTSNGCQTVVSISEYRARLSEYRNSYHIGAPSDEQIVQEYYLKILNKASQIAEDNMELLLWNLRRRLETAFLNNYPSAQGASAKYAFLMNASKAIAAYRDQWDLGTGRWTEVEEDAANELAFILLENGTEEQYQTVRRLERQGRTIETTGRDTYQRYLERVKEWVYRNIKRFPAAQESRIREDIQILQDAIRKIRRQTKADTKIHEVLFELGKSIAEGCAEISYTDELQKECFSTEQGTIVWPVGEENRTLFEKWAIIASDSTEQDMQNPMHFATNFDRTYLN